MDNVMGTRTIICPVDFSTFSESAIETATSLARDRDAKLLIVHVQKPPIAVLQGEVYYGMDLLNRKELETMLQAGRPADPAVRYEHRLLAGDPAEAIVNLAETERAELIVLATHGRTGLLRLLMGSIAEAVLRKAKCAVLLLKSQAPVPVKS